MYHVGKSSVNGVIMLMLNPSNFKLIIVIVKRYKEFDDNMHAGFIEVTA